MNKLSIRLIFILGTISFCFLGIQRTIEYGGFEQFETQTGIIPEGWSGQELNELSAIIKTALFLILCSFTFLGYRITKKFRIESVFNTLFDFIGLSVAFALLAAFLIKFVPFDLLTITNVNPSFNPGFKKMLGSLFHLSILSFLLGATVWVLEEAIKKRSDFSSFKVKRSSIWLSFFLLYIFLYLVLLLTISGITNTSFIASRAFANFVQVILLAIYCTICSWAFYFIFPSTKSVKSIKKWGFYLIFSLGLIGWIFLLFAAANAFDFNTINAFVHFNQWLFVLFIIMIIVGVSMIVRKFNWFGFQDALNLSERTAEIGMLKSQINPHFLFNSLNSLYGLALAESSPKTSTGIQKLSEMMRFMLRENVEDKIEISREFEYVENYIELQKLRIEGNKKVKLDYHIDKACDGQVTPMLIIPFIENAFKHGVSTHHNSQIDIHLKCSDDSIQLNVKNSNHKKDKKSDEESGIGLENVRQRLAMIYPGKHLFQIFEDENTFEANINIELS